MFKTLISIMLILILIPSIFSAKVEGNAQISPKETVFNYQISISEEEGINSFSFEKPRDAKILVAQDSNNELISYNSAGDFFIFNLNSNKNETYFIKFRSYESSTKILETGDFSNYVNFNIPVESIQYSINLDSDLPLVNEIFPRSYERDARGLIKWNITQIEEDTLFLIKFEVENRTNETTPNIVYYLLAGILLILALLTGIVYKRWGKNEKREIIEVRKEVVKEEKQESKKEEIKKEESYEELINKYLTDNEKKVVDIVKENNGISQYDILNFIPKMTKSNLSKIISKLHSKKFLNRIRVGKVNKIHLGERLENK